MKPTELLRRKASTITARNPHIEINAVQGVQDRGSRQMIATIWIIAAWLIGTLVSELNVVGGQPERKDPIDEYSLAPDSILQQWNEWETEFAMVHSGIVAFDRLQQNSQIRVRIDAIIAAETKRLAAANNRQRLTESLATAVAPTASTPTNPQSPPQNGDTIRLVATDEIVRTHDDAMLRLAYDDADSPQETKVELAWKGFPEGSVPGLVDLVARSFHELMVPVHVQNPETGEPATPFAKNSAQSDGSVTYVETDMQESHSAADSLQPLDLAFAEIDQQEAKADEVQIIHSADRLRIVRSRPQMLRVKESAVLASPVETEPSSNSDHDAFSVIVPPNASATAKPDEAQTRVDNSILAGTGQAKQNPIEPRSARSVLVGTGSPGNVQGEMALAADAMVGTGLAQDVPTTTGPNEQQFPEPRVAAKWPFDRIEPSGTTDVTLNVDQVDVRSVFEMLARGYKMNILVAPDVVGTVTANVDHLTPQQTLQGIVKMCDLTMQQEGDLIYIYPADKVPLGARELRVFPLDFARASTIEPTVQGLLSPVGNAYPSTISESDNMQSRESIVVVDIPRVVAQVEEYILQADRAPRQVMIEAKILEVVLSDDMEHGIDFGALLSGDLAVGTVGFVLPTPGDNPSSPTFFGSINGTRLKGVLDLLETTLDAKTLASPRVQVLNGQNARIQVGQQLGFKVLTVTQTSTIEDVQFLETGVVLSVTPTISRDDRILMQVKPEVSKGEIDPDTQLPEEETREVETSVLLDNHQGMIIGGLIDEKDRTEIQKLPWLGDVKYIGKFFQHRKATRARTEIIVALIPHIVEPSVRDDRSLIEHDRTQTPLFHGTLQRTCRPWEPRLPDRAGEHDHMDVNNLNRMLP